MLIGELSTKTGLSRDTIRFYEKQRLIIVPSKERRDNNYKEYSNEVYTRLLRIKHIKEFGFTLNETSELLDMIDSNTASCKKVEEQVTAKVSIIDRKIEELLQLKSQMLSMVSDCCHPGSEDGNCPSLTPSA